jgi:hypothetical protein
MKTLKMLSVAAAGAAALTLGSGPANAADPVRAPVVSPTVVQPPIIPATVPATLAGYVEVFGGLNAGRSWWDDGYYTSTWRGAGFGGAGRAAWLISPSFSWQLDVWAEHWSGRYRFCYDFGADCDDENSWDANFKGIATHLTFRTPAAWYAGALLSLGAHSWWWYSFFGNIAAEAGTNIGNLRLAGQLGHVRGFGDAVGYSALYAMLVTTFYVNPHFAISGNIGLHRDNDDQRVLRIGARVEMQPQGKPFTVFAAYQSHFGRDVAYGDRWKDHFVGVGVSLLVGAPNLRERDRLVGLADNNPIYGPTFPR